MLRILIFNVLKLALNFPAIYCHLNFRASTVGAFTDKSQLFGTSKLVQYKKYGLCKYKIVRHTTVVKDCNCLANFDKSAVSLLGKP